MNSSEKQSNILLDSNPRKISSKEIVVFYIVFITVLSIIFIGIMYSAASIVGEIIN